jgi:hypothetical protein
MPKAQTRVRWITAGALALTLLMLGTCSATGMSNARGTGAQLIARDPGSYLLTIGPLVGPLLALMAVSGLLTIGRIGQRRSALLLVTIVASGAGALLTAYAAFIASYAGLCVAGSPTLAQDAACAAGSGAVASVFGTAILAAIPFVVALRRDPR